MPHQCVSCKKFYDDGSDVILKGCTKCGGKLFFFVKKSRLEEIKREQEDEMNTLFNLSDSDKKQIEKDVYDILGSEVDKDKPIVLDIESIHIKKPGTYELDLVNLFQKKEPLIYKLEDGKYVIDLVESFKKMRGSKKK